MLILLKMIVIDVRRNADDMYTTTDTGGRRHVSRCWDDVLSYVSPHESPTATTSESKRFLAAKP